MVRSICQGDFLSKSAIAAWEFLEDLAKKTIKWETTRDDSLSSTFVRGGLHSVSNVSHLESKIAVLENILKDYFPRCPVVSDIYNVLFSLLGPRSFFECLSLFCSLVSN